MERRRLRTLKWLKEVRRRQSLVKRTTMRTPPNSKLIDSALKIKLANIWPHRHTRSSYLPTRRGLTCPRSILLSDAHFPSSSIPETDQKLLLFTRIIDT